MPKDELSRAMSREELVLEMAKLCKEFNEDNQPEKESVECELVFRTTSNRIFVNNVNLDIRGSMDPISEDYIGHTEARHRGAMCICPRNTTGRRLDRDIDCPWCGR